MHKKGWQSVFWLCILGCAFLYVTYFLSRDLFCSDSYLINAFREKLQKEFTSDAETVSKNAENYLNSSLPTSDTSSFKAPVYLKYNLKGKLIQWSQNYFILHQAHVSAFLKRTEPALISYNNNHYFAQICKNDSQMVVALLPLKIEFPVKNKYLSPYLYSGTSLFSKKVISNLKPSVYRFREIENQPQINFKGHTVFYLSDLPASAIRQTLRIYELPGLIIMAIATIFLLLLHFKRLNKQKKVVFLWQGWSFLLFIRMIALWSGFPSSFVNIELFQPDILAINTWNPSLGDFCTNVFLTISFFYLLIFTFPVGIFNKQVKPIWFVLLVMSIALISAISFKGFYELFARVSSDSQVSLEISDLFALDLNTLIVYLNLAVALFVLFLLFNHIFIILIKISPDFPDRFPQYVLAEIFTLFFLLSLNLGSTTITLRQSLVLLSFLYFIYFLSRWQISGNTFRLRFPEGVMVCLFLSLVLNIAITETFSQEIKSDMEQAAAKYSDARDVFTEYLFDEVQRKLKRERIPLSDDDSIQVTVREYLARNYLDNKFKGYFYNLFLFDGSGKEIDPQPGKVPVYNPFLAPLSPDQIGGEKTTTSNLFLFPRKNSAIDKMYLGKLDLSVVRFGRVTAMLELLPRSIQTDRLYPTLLIDDRVSLRKLPTRFHYAIYRNNLLMHKDGDLVFPLKLPYEYAKAGFIPEFIRENEELVLLQKLGGAKVLILRARARSLLDQVTSFSILFYFFLLLYLISYLPKRLNQLLKYNNFHRHLSFSSKLQAVLFGFCLLPFVVSFFLFRPFIRESFEEETKSSMVHILTSAGSELENNYLPNLLKRKKDLHSLSALNNELDHLSILFGNDFNLYDVEGTMLVSTQPRVYDLGLVSRKMNPVAWKSLKNGTRTEYTARENIGRLSYRSAYLTLQNQAQRPIAYLNVPYLSQQEAIEARIRRFLSYLINIYVVVLLLLGTLAVTLSRALIQPLTLLKVKLEKTNIGESNDAIPVTGRDEISSLIKSYNQMVYKLRMSEQKLAQSERETAWREMARQVAHEIKNPLTPMKLSIQHLQKTYKDNSPTWPELFSKLTKSLLLQIESLSNIASSFSSFAAMPGLNNTNFDLTQLVREVSAVYLPSDEVEIISEIPESSFYISADKDQIARALGNIIKNALHAIREKGLVKLKMSVSENKAIIEIEDTGIGISEDIKDRIFEPNFSTKTSGMGLGLALAKRAIDSAGGKISFTSVINQGTVFHIEIPGTIQP